jgi:tRNA (guanine-N7-)-methyltransferase
MRQRKIKDVENKIAAYENFLVRNPEALAGEWRAFLSSNNFDKSPERRLFIEIGSGKGRFLTGKAASDPEGLYVGFEGQLSALYRALTKAAVAPAPANFRFCPEYLSDIREFFAEGEVSGIFLNFSDPWPKKRQEKRRLTSPSYLNGYAHVLARGGFIEFKTDNVALFEYSIEKLRECQDFELTAVTADLHRSEYAAGVIETEYEHKFRNLNRPIHFLRVVRR